MEVYTDEIQKDEANKKVRLSFASSIVSYLFHDNKKEFIFLLSRSIFSTLFSQ